MSGKDTSGNPLKRKQPPSQDEDNNTKKKKDQEKWKKRSWTCYRKLKELSMLCDVDVYALICRQGEIYTLNTADNGSFPPPESALVSLSSQKHKFFSNDKKGGIKGRPEIAGFQQRLQARPPAQPPETRRSPSRGMKVIRAPVWKRSEK